MIRRPPRSTHCISSAASDVYKRQVNKLLTSDIDTESFIAVIRSNHPLFKNLTYRSAGMIFGKGRILKLKPSQILFKEGMKGDLVCIVLYGKILLRRADRGVLGVAMPGESVGEEIVFGHTVR
eukprot:TRINITY_DN9007_c0_g1_i4.p2 TRINITY_DN9007_c0_g1~~TRINITY_DN9007_c0_g1_i4.p2  ORF type:complete len:131 (+),score=40.05 TRINITY_DN9007_c0_g1_i4:26-394(+)